MNRYELTQFIEETFDIKGESLWVHFPNYLVFRNPRNKKWFGLIGDVERSKLGLEGQGKVDVFVFKCDPIMTGTLLDEKGFLPAYHMSRKSWMTALLDGSANEEKIKELACIAYEIIESKK
ncbi:MAG: MmcQ/YjbR family DNA-binding protein [Eubacterium sp.]|nr:MmcQ/YjbR family DNA-binding protein [Eubacterium sp.]